MTTIIQEQTALQKCKECQVCKFCPVKYQKYYIQIHLEICQEIFNLTALIDTGSDINLLNKEIIPAKYWAPSFGSAVGLGNQNTDFQYEVPRGTLLLEDYG
jgi:hypothetical protein